MGERIQSHEKSMGRYEMHAHSDAVSIAFMLNQLYGYGHAKQVYLAYDRRTVLDFELKYESHLASYIQKTEAQRESYFRKLTKNVDDNTRILFLTLALIGVIRAREMIALRDRYRMVLAPGCSYRSTTASMYEMSCDLRSLFCYDWPYEVFESIDIYDDDEDGDDNEPSDEMN